jgi:hypothetical protein
LLEQLEREPLPTLDQFIRAIDVMTTTEKHCTPDQQRQLEQRREKLGDDGIRQAERDWAALIEAVKTERANGTPPRAARSLTRHGRSRADAVRRPSARQATRARMCKHSRPSCGPEGRTSAASIAAAAAY